MMASCECRVSALLHVVSGEDFERSRNRGDTLPCKAHECARDVSTDLLVPALQALSLRFALRIGGGLKVFQFSCLSGTSV